MSEIIKKVYYAVEAQLASPLSISNGVGIETDSDLLKTSDGKVFIPGTSVAGALRSNIDINLRDMITGFSEGEKGRMSKLYVSDLCFDEGIESVRDGIKLTEEKVVDNKYDFEVLETGTKGIMFLSYVIRNGDHDDIFEKTIISLLKGINDGQIRFGANKNRGYGRLKIQKVYSKSFGKKDVDDYIKFNSRNLCLYNLPQKYEEWASQHTENLDQYVKITVPLRLTGGISIRKYSTRPNEADYSQLTVGMEKKPVVPGNSWNGAIRSDALSILKELGVVQAERYINQWFGHIKEKGWENKKARQSSIVIGESMIDESIPLKMTRNKINRFDASTQNEALYTEISYFGGKTNLEIWVKKYTEFLDAKSGVINRSKIKYKEIIGLLLLVIQDITEGYVAIGGQTAVGRGIFEADGEIRFDNADFTYSDCCSAFSEYLQEAGSCG